jgi:hypothetical protein
MGYLEGFGGGRKSSFGPQDIAAALRFSRRSVSCTADLSSNNISLKKREHHLSQNSNATYFKISLISLKLGLLLGSYDQHCDISEYNLGGQFAGSASRSPLSIFVKTSLFFTPWNGFTPNINISHMHTPGIDKLHKTGRTWKGIRTEHPDIARYGKTSEIDALGTHPLDGQLPFRRFVVTLVVAHRTRKSKIGQLDAVVGTN